MSKYPGYKLKHEPGNAEDFGKYYNGSSMRKRNDRKRRLRERNQKKR